MGSGKSHGTCQIKACRDRLKGLVMGSGKSHGTCHFQSVSTQAERVSYGSGKSHGTCHFQSVSRQAERVSYGEWQVPWDLPFSDIQDRKVTPFEYFLRVFSTNQKPGFQALDQ